jgi:hypothetical protein
VRAWAIVPFLTFAGGAIASPFEGSWINEKSGHFSLELIANGRLVCGQVTSISGSKVDASWIIGRIDGKRAVVQFSSGFGERMAKGTATIRPLQSEMEWRIVQSPPGESWVFENVRGGATAWKKGRRATLTTWCARNWSAIEQRSTSAIDLRP